MDIFDYLRLRFVSVGKDGVSTKKELSISIEEYVELCEFFAHVENNSGVRISGKPCKVTGCFCLNA